MASPLMGYELYSNYTSDDYDYVPWSGALPSPQEAGFSAPNGKQFKEWNTSKYGTAASYSIGDIPDFEPGLSIFAIWQNSTYSIYRNYSSSDTTSVERNSGTALPNPSDLGWSTPNGKQFKEWNTNSQGTGTSYSIGSSPTFEPGLICYAIWEDVVITEYKTDNIELGTIANAIRTKGGTSASLVYPTGFVSAINNINAGTDVSDTTATANDVLSSKYFYTAAGIKTQGNIPAQAAQTITPTTTNQTIAAGKYLTGAQTIAGDSNLVAANIAKGITIFGVVGTHSGGSDPDLIPANIKTGVDILGVVGTYGGGPSSGSINIDQNGYYDVTNYASASINVTSGGSTQKLANGVNFYDYDGTVLYSYSVSEFANLSAMPTNPSHAGLTAQGWNWTLADAKTYVAKYGRLEVGQMYITDDGKTRVCIHLEQGRTSPMLGCCPNGTVDVDWGDGTAHDTLTGTNTGIVKWTPNHAYAAPGDYVIKLTVTGSMGFYGNSSTAQYAGLLRYTSSTDNRNYVYQNTIQRVEIGSSVTSIGSNVFRSCYSLTNVTIPNSVTSIGSSVFQNCYSLTNVIIPDSVTSIGSNAFQSCSSLTNVTIPNSVTSIGNNAFQNCYSLTNVTIPDRVTSIGSSVFQNCYSLTNVIIPDSVTSIGSNAFQTCYSLTNVTIPDSVTSIGNYAFQTCSSLTNVTIPDRVTSIGSNAFSTNYSLTNVTIPDSVTSISYNAFQNCYSLAEYHLAPTTPPTLSSTSVFTNIAADCVIYVPYSADHSILNAYKTASNWSNYASYMQEETI